MADTLSSTERSQLMSRVRNKGTAPELTVRRALHAAGLRFRLHRKDLPGRPDIVLPGRRLAIFVHGCFWHGHDCRRGRRPQDNADFWAEKIGRNQVRDAAARNALLEAGWSVEILWQCELKTHVAPLVDRLKAPRADCPTR